MIGNETRKRTAPGQGMMVARCTDPERHALVTGDPCMMCDRNATDARAEVERFNASRLRHDPAATLDAVPPMPRRTRAPDSPAFAGLAREAERLGLPEHFTADVWEWDRWLLARWNASGRRIAFVVTLGLCGSHIVRVDAEPLPTGKDPEVETLDAVRVVDSLKNACVWYAGWCDRADIVTLTGAEEAGRWVRAAFVTLDTSRTAMETLREADAIMRGDR